MFYADELFLFNGLKQNEKDEIISGLSKPADFKKGEIIYSAQSFPNAIGVILEGDAFAVSNNESRLYMRSFKEGTCFGAAAIFGKDEPYVSTITAKTDVKILFITEPQLESIFLKYPKTSLNYIGFLSDKIRFLNKKLGILGCNTAEDTLFNYLNSISDKNGVAELPSNMTLLSKSLGISRASLYRCLDTLENDGLILKEKNIVKVIKNEKNH